MLRYILKRVQCDMNCGMQSEHVTMFTIDGDVTEVEQRLRSGGSGPSGFDRTELVGVSVLDDLAANDKGEGR